MYVEPIPPPRPKPLRPPLAKRAAVICRCGKPAKKRTAADGPYPKYCSVRCFNRAHTEAWLARNTAWRRLPFGLSQALRQLAALGVLPISKQGTHS